MSQSVPASFQTKYHNNVEMRLQQHKSKLVDAVMVTNETSAEKCKIKDIVGTGEAHEADERHGDTKYGNTPHDGIWLPQKPALYYADIIDKSDSLSTAVDLEGAYVNEGAAVVERSKDRRILEGFFAPVISGKEGTVVTPLPSSQIIGVNVGGASGAQRFNTKKLREANKLLKKGHVMPGDKKFMVLTAEQNDDLLAEVPATSADFKSSFSAELDDDGNVIRMLGWNFIHMELDNPALKGIPELTVDGNGYRKNPFWVKSGVHANFWEELFTRVGELPMKNYSTGCYARTQLAATRGQFGKSGYVLNRES